MPRLRRWIPDHLGGDEGDLDTTITAMPALIDRGSLRIKAPDYSEANDSHGALTLRARHVAFVKGAIWLTYRGKGITLKGTEVTRKTSAEAPAFMAKHDDGDKVRKSCTELEKPEYQALSVRVSDLLAIARRSAALNAPSLNFTSCECAAQSHLVSDHRSAIRSAQE